MSCRGLKPLPRKQFPRLLAPVEQDRRAAKTQVSPLVVNRIYFTRNLELILFFYRWGQSFTV